MNPTERELFQMPFPEDWDWFWCGSCFRAWQSRSLWRDRCSWCRPPYRVRPLDPALVDIVTVCWRLSGSDATIPIITQHYGIACR